MTRVVPLVTHEPSTSPPRAARGPWYRPDWNTMIGGYFKFHWLDPQMITVKVDDA